MCSTLPEGTPAEKCRCRHAANCCGSDETVYPERMHHTALRGGGMVLFAGFALFYDSETGVCPSPLTCQVLEVSVITDYGPYVTQPARFWAQRNGQEKVEPPDHEARNVGSRPYLS